MKKDIRTYKRNGNQFAYILDSIDTENFGIIAATDKDKITFFFDTFNKEYNTNYNKRNYPNLQARISEYLKGLPSCINLPFYDNDIATLLQSWNIKASAKNVGNYWKVIACRLIQIAEYYNIDFYQFY